jgi:hypothetical protein
MLRLKKIRRDGNLISAIYDPEASGVLGDVCVNIETQAVENGAISNYENQEYPDYYYHAIAALKTIANEKELPSERLVMWY